MGWLTLVGAGVSALGQMKQGESDKDDAYLQATMIEAEGKAKADKIRRLGRAQVSEADAAAAASGVQVGTGSVADVERKIFQDAAEDEYNTLINSELQAKQIRRAGRAAANSGVAQGAGSALGAGASYYGSRWKRSGNATVGGVQ